MNTCKQQSINSFTLSWQRSSSYRNQSIDLFCRSMDCLLYNRDLRHERFKTLFIHIHRRSVLTCCKAEFVFFFFFVFYLAFLSRIFTIHRTAGEGEGYFPILFLTLPPALQTIRQQTLRHQLGYSCRELISAHSWEPELKMKPLVHAL